MEESVFSLKPKDLCRFDNIESTVHRNIIRLKKSLDTICSHACSGLLENVNLSPRSSKEMCRGVLCLANHVWKWDFSFHKPFMPWTYDGYKFIQTYVYLMEIRIFSSKCHKVKTESVFRLLVYFGKKIIFVNQNNIRFTA